MAIFAHSTTRRATHNVAPTTVTVPAPRVAGQGSVLTRNPKALIAIFVVLAIASFAINVAGLRWPLGVGGSMQPTIRDGQRVFYVNPWRQLRKGDIVLVKTDPPYDDGFTAKRINKFGDQGRLWLLGDNREESFDSELYGWVEPSRVVGLCLMRLPRCFDGPDEAVVDGQGVLPVDKDLKEKKGAPPALYSSGFPRVYAWLLRQKMTFKLGFTIGKMTKDYFIENKDGGTAMIYYFGQRAEIQMGGRRIVVPATDQVTAMVLDVRDHSKIQFFPGDGYSYFRVWIYDADLHPHPKGKLASH